MNPYVGCDGGCRFCYAQQTVREPGKNWGEFVRTRDHISHSLAAQLHKYHGKSLLIGTMTDPYLSQERISRLTRASLQIVSEHTPPAVGIFTRFPTVVQDIDLLTRLKKPVVHFSWSPYSEKIRKLLEPGCSPNSARQRAIKELVQAGIICHAQVSPLIPGFSDHHADIRRISAAIATSGLTVARLDPLQAYSAAQATMLRTLKDNISAQTAQRFEQAMTDTHTIKRWAAEQHDMWLEAWRQEGAGSSCRLVWADHTTWRWEDMLTGDAVEVGTKWAVPTSTHYGITNKATRLSNK